MEPVLWFLVVAVFALALAVVLNGRKQSADQAEALRVQRLIVETLQAQAKLNAANLETFEDIATALGDLYERKGRDWLDS